MMGRCGLALLAALPFAVAATAPTCYDRLLKNGDPWTDAVTGATCEATDMECSWEEHSRNEFLSAEACCHCGGGTVPYYVELPSNDCVNDGEHALQIEGLLTYRTKEDCCKSLPAKEARACLKEAKRTEEHPVDASPEMRYQYQL